MFKKNGIEPLAQHVYLSSPTMHGEEFQYMKEAYDTNWMSTVGANINEVEKSPVRRLAASMQWLFQQELRRYIWQSN